MDVVDCPVCGRRVNAEAVGCPECGVDPRLAADEARATPAGRRYLAADRSQEPPPPGWSRRRRWLTGIPAMVLPVALAAAGVCVFVSGWHFYFSLPVAERSDGDPFPNDGLMQLGLLIVFVAIVLASLALGASWPRRLATGLGTTLLAVSCVVLGLTVSATAWLSLGAWGIAACLLLAYIPALLVVRLVWQFSVGRPTGTATPVGDARPTSAST